MPDSPRGSAASNVRSEGESPNNEATDVRPAPTAPCPFCDLPGRLMGSGERYVCDNRHYWRAFDEGVIM